MTHDVDWDRWIGDLPRLLRICHRVAQPWGIDGEVLASDVLLELIERPPGDDLSEAMVARMASRHAYRIAGWQ